MIPKRLLSLIPLFLVTGCRTTPTGPGDTGFLADDYERLEPVASPEPGVEMFRYVDPKLDLSGYSALMLDPVLLYQTAFVSQDGRKVSEEDLYQVRLKLDQEIERRVKQKNQVVRDPGEGVIRVSVAITGAEIEGQGFKPRNLVPVAAVLFAAQKATDFDRKTPQLVVEAKVRDSLSGKVLGQAVYNMDGQHFRRQSTTLEAFSDLAVEWVGIAIRLAAGRRQAEDSGPGESASP